MQERTASNNNDSCGKEKENIRQIRVRRCDVM